MRASSPNYSLAGLSTSQSRTAGATVRRQPLRFQGPDQRDLPEGQDIVVRRTPDPELEEVPRLHGHGGIHGQPQDHLHRANAENSRARARPRRAEVGPQATEDHTIVASKLGQPHADVQIHADDL